MSEKKILIVEDEESLLALLSILLKTKGYEVEKASNGQAAMNALAERKPDLVLLDVGLPMLDGFEVCRRIKNNPSTKDIPVVLVTGKKSAKDMDMGQKVGADGHITKPFKMAHVIEELQRFLYPGLP